MPRVDFGTGSKPAGGSPGGGDDMGVDRELDVGGTVVVFPGMPPDFRTWV
jgi:hypothetical protein